MNNLKRGHVLKHNGYYYNNGFHINVIEGATVFKTEADAEAEIEKHCSNKFAQNNLVFKVITVYIY